MEFEINIRNMDIIRMITYAHIRNKAIWAMCLIPALLINSISVVGLWAMEFPFQESLSVLGDFFMWLFGLFFAGLFLIIITLLLNPKWRKGRVGVHKIEITEKGIIESTEYNRSEIYWLSIHRVSSKPSGLFFMFSGSDAFVIPRHNFESEASWREFESKFLSKANA